MLGNIQALDFFFRRAAQTNRLFDNSKHQENHNRGISSHTGNAKELHTQEVKAAAVEQVAPQTP